MSETKRRLKEIIVKGLRIADRSPSELSDDQPLLDGDIEIDSIDVLQLVLDIEKQFGIKLIGGKFDRDAWRTISTLAAAVEAKLKEPAAT